MYKALIVAASFGLSLSTASACEFMRSAKAIVDPTVVASVATEEQMSTPQQVIILDEAATSEAAKEVAQ